MQEFADLLHVIATATADDASREPEAKQIRARWEELKSGDGRFCGLLRGGKFQSHPQPRRQAREVGLNPPHSLLVLDFYFRAVSRTKNEDDGEYDFYSPAFFLVNVCVAWP